MTRLLFKIIRLMVNILMIPVVLILAVPMGVLKVRKDQKNMLLYTNREQRFHLDAQQVIDMDSNAMMSPDKDLLAVANCIKNASIEYQLIKSRERFDITFTEFVIPKINSCHVIDWDNVIGYYNLPELGHLGVSLENPELAWIYKLWEWADSFKVLECDFPRSKSELLNLEVISFHGTGYIGEKKISFLPKEICYLNNLKALRLGSIVFPELSLFKVIDFPIELVNLKNLVCIHAQYNFLTELPSGIGCLINLKDIQVNVNEISHIPKEIGLLNELEILVLSDNKLEYLPAEVGFLKNLKVLSLSANPLLSLPKEIINLSQLDKLCLQVVPNLILTREQKCWIKELVDSGCDVRIDDLDDMLKGLEDYDSFDDDIPF